ncbi:MAG TPA: hypothetical protein VLG12_08480 [Candidatus Saccharimonadales bacterium]|nr:hypothetical protein [Candidatus Saccharimonadales bacterium]
MTPEQEKLLYEAVFQWVLGLNLSEEFSSFELKPFKSKPDMWWIISRNANNDEVQIGAVMARGKPDGSIRIAFVQRT